MSHALARRLPSALVALLVAAVFAAADRNDAAQADPGAAQRAARAGEVFVRDAQGNWVPRQDRATAHLSGSAAAGRTAGAVGSLTPATRGRRAAGTASGAMPTALTAGEFARRNHLAFTDHGTYGSLQHGTIMIRLYADSPHAVVMRKRCEFKEPVRRQDGQLVIPACAVRYLEAAASSERSSVHEARVRKQQRAAQRKAQIARRNARLEAMRRAAAATPPASRPPAARPPAARSHPPRPTRISARPKAGWVPSGVVERRWKWIILHHSDDTVGDADKYHRVHLEDNGWEHGLGYHFVIGNGSLSRDGEVEVGPRWRKQLHGAHAKTPDNRFNDFGVGICLVGDFDVGDSRPTGDQMDSLVQLVRWLQVRYGIALQDVQGHCDCEGCATACPGCNFPWAELRRRLR